jgi:hypothetical protein
MPEIAVAEVVADESEQVKLARIAKSAADRYSDAQALIQQQEIEAKIRIAEIQAMTRKRELELERERHAVELHVNSGMKPYAAFELVNRLNEREASIKRENKFLQEQRDALNFDKDLFAVRMWFTSPFTFGMGFLCGYQYLKYVAKL